ncbi:MAG: hypothetical protein JKY52_07905, partial [Flavobacteriales bacterium]|nr:hypothetical protein [Flavobacteriales bacterium]
MERSNKIKSEVTLEHGNSVNLDKVGLNKVTSLKGVNGNRIVWRKKALAWVFLIGLTVYNMPTAFSQVGIGTATPDASAILDLTSTTKGMLISRVTLVQRNAIVSPATGLLVFQTDNTPGYYYWNGTAWVQMLTGSGSGSGWATTGNSGLSAATNFLGTTDKVPLVFRTDNAERMRVDTTTGNVGIGTTSPWAKLQLFTNSGGIWEVIETTAAGFDPNLLLRTATNGWTIKADQSDNDKLNIGVNDTVGGSLTPTVMTFTTAGNVGIGTTSPGSLLHVSGGDLKLTGVSSTAGTGSHLLFDGNRPAHIWLDDQLDVGTPDQADLYFSVQSGSKAFNFGHSAGLYTKADFVNWMTINDGQVGIGITSPTKTLDVNGGGRFRTGDLNIWSFDATEGGQINLANGGINADGQPNAWSLDVWNDHFRIMDDGTVKVFIENTGNVGIGTTTPSDLLHLEGGKLRMRSGGPISLPAGNFGALHYDEIQGNLDLAAHSTGGNTAIRFFTSDNATATEKMRIDSIGRVGIGTTSPSSTLQLEGSGSGFEISLNNVATNGREYRILSGDNGPLRFHDATAGVDRIRIDPSGNVGIGTITPSALLDVSGTASGILIPRVTLVQRNAIVAPVTSELVFQTDNTPGYYYWDGAAWVQMLTGSGSGSGWATTGNAGLSAATNFLGTTDKVPLVFRTDNIERMRVDTTTGNVGIGTTTPGGKLHVVTSAVDVTNIATTLSTIPSSDAVTLAYSPGDGSTSTWLLREKWDPTNWGLLHDNTRDDFHFVGNNLSRLMISLNTGNIGIGTTTPGAKLHVLTTSGSSNIFVESPTGSYGFVRYKSGTTFWDLAERDNEYSGAFQFRYAGGVPQMVIQTAGNVGIGTTSPGEKLELAGSAYINSEGAGFIVDASGNQRVGLIKELGFAGELRHLSAVDLSVRRVTAGTLVAPTASDVVMTFDGPTGNVGIGTTTPGGKLHVVTTAVDVTTIATTLSTIPSSDMVTLAYSPGDGSTSTWLLREKWDPTNWG